MRKQDVINHYRLQLQEQRRKAGMRSTDVTEYAAVIELARAVNLTPNAIYRWPEELDFHRQCIIQVVTNGRFVADPDAPANRISQAKRDKKSEAAAIRERLGLSS